MDSLPDNAPSFIEAEVRKLLAENDRIRAIGICRVQLDCDFDAAHAIVRLVERVPQGNSQIHDALHKAAGNRSSYPTPSSTKQREEPNRRHKWNPSKPTSHGVDCWRGSLSWFSRLLSPLHCATA